VSKSSVTLGLIRCASRPFDPWPPRQTVTHADKTLNQNGKAVQVFVANLIALRRDS
jgi:hypothetical protein